MKLRHRHVVALFALSLQLVLSLPHSAGLVLCVGTDGHIAVESGSCTDEVPGEFGRCDELGARTTCTDTPLTASELRSSPPRAGTDGAVAGLAPIFRLGTEGAAAARGRSAADAPRGAAEASRTTVLRL
jgi:hypothetical protein